MSFDYDHPEEPRANLYHVIKMVLAGIMDMFEDGTPQVPHHQQHSLRLLQVYKRRFTSQLFLDKGEMLISAVALIYGEEDLPHGVESPMNYQNAVDLLYNLGAIESETMNEHGYVIYIFSDDIMRLQKDFRSVKQNTRVTTEMKESKIAEILIQTLDLLLVSLMNGMPLNELISGS